MKKIKYILSFLIILCFSSIALTSCSDFLDEYSQHMIVAKSVKDLDEVLIGEGYIKSSVVSTGPSGTKVAGFFNILSDDVNTGSVGVETSKTWNSCLSGIFGYYAWQLRVGSNFNASSFSPDHATWDDHYKRINIINILLDEIEQMPHSLNEDLTTYLRVKGEAHFLRAYYYFTLANLYGDAYSPETASSKLCVPLKLTPYVEHDRNKDTQFTRASIAEVYSQIVSDLQSAEKFLIESPQDPKRYLHRASYEAVELLYSRVALYMQDWKTAENKASKVMNSQRAQLASFPSFENKAFLVRENPEILFSQGSNHLNTTDIFTARPGDFCVTKELRDLYSENDVRANCFFGTHASDSITLTNKYERGNSIQSHISDVFTLRTAEAYLNYAEACVMQKNKDSEARKAINLLCRNRIKNYVDITLSGEDLVREIRNERRRELCFEGHRWFDLRRYAVNTLFPYSRTICHIYHACGDAGVSYTQEYQLESNDPAYTFAIPEAVIKFDRVPMPDNFRPNRLPIKKEKE